MDLSANSIRFNGLVFYARYRDLIAKYALVRTAGVGEENGDYKWTLLLLVTEVWHR